MSSHLKFTVIGEGPRSVFNIIGKLSDRGAAIAVAEHHHGATKMGAQVWANWRSRKNCKNEYVVTSGGNR